ncbi:hypothetical protein GORHZ_110_00070 [Gordonia rhizosphera NBRC 16068]|uniref:Transposase IS204/IS1001/IS1096/IS1165 DDE domain-containing protein n=1 Tax=Gordonia rhizosphera NBRC 16068 TaxID=1108045 RepID=K6VUL3_9ACTN|nr:hypothetical protein GORHZ_110_00070 [Gordonia rhizosphera NBRC 16068]
MRFTHGSNQPHWASGVDLRSSLALIAARSSVHQMSVNHAVLQSNTEFHPQILWRAPVSTAYAAAVTDTLLPNAEVVVDHFHLVKLANEMVTARLGSIRIRRHEEAVW